jgi:hypothetical protein
LEEEEEKAEDKDEAVVTQAMGEVRIVFYSVVVFKTECQAPKKTVCCNQL